MNILKFIKSFNTINSYLILAFMILILISIYFYIINPKY
ncbi:hypothetical protein ACT4YP_14130 [Acinetobacter baumannii]